MLLTFGRIPVDKETHGDQPHASQAFHRSLEETQPQLARPQEYPYYESSFSRPGSGSHESRPIAHDQLAPSGAI